jgi:tetratricopeptide (TPR) repeat protein
MVRMMQNEYYNQCWQRGKEYYEREDWEMALEAFKKAIEGIYWNNPFAHNYLGFCYEKIGLRKDAIKTFQHAIELFQKAIDINPEDAELHFGLGRAYNEMDNCKRIKIKRREQPDIESFKKAISLKPDFADAYYYLGEAYKNLFPSSIDELKDAIKALKKAISLKPDYPYAFDILWEAYWELGQKYYKLGCYQDAIKAYKQAVQIEPNHKRMHYELGIAHIENGDKKSALNEVRILQKLDSELEDDFFFNLGLGKKLFKKINKHFIS